jgi:spermidine synthase
VAKIQLQSLDETGTIVGSLSALGTAGAIFGTFVTGFVLIAALPSRPITWAVGGALVAVGTVLAIRRGAGAAVLSALALLALVVAGSAAVGGPCERETAYFCARVNVDPNRPTGRELILDTLRHSYVDLEDPEYLGSRYARVIADVIETSTAETQSVLYIGGGGFTLPRYFLATEGADATVLELDSTVVEIAEAELGLVPGPWLRIETGDARITLGDAPTDSYDAVVGDAFGGPSVPWHLTTEEFLIDVKARLRPGGVYAMNVIDHPPARFVRAEVATLNAVFGHVAVVAPPELLDGSTGGNFVLVASDSPIDGSGIESVITARNGREVVITDTDAIDFAADAQVLRDEYAPVDQLLGRP